MSKEIKIENFKNEMIKELSANEYKGDWEKFTHHPAIWEEYEYHNKKLNSRVTTGHKEGIREAIADSANLLLMLGNAYGLYDKINNERMSKEKHKYFVLELSLEDEGPGVSEDEMGQMLEDIVSVIESYEFIAGGGIRPVNEDGSEISGDNG